MYDVVDVVDFFDDPELWKAVAFIILNKRSRFCGVSFFESFKPSI